MAGQGTEVLKTISAFSPAQGSQAAGTLDRGTKG